MNIELEPGKYVLAVSGGVDSVVLLDVLVNQNMRQETGDRRQKKNTPNSQPLTPNYELLTTSYEIIVAHYDHGIRADSKKDRELVENLAKKYGLEFYFGEGDLGPKTSEALAREKRYEFLKKIKKQTKSGAIVTAHHKDDVLETAIINVIRGTGRKGLSSLSSTDDIKRPLLNYDKKTLLNYAKQNRLKWHEDETNLDQKYLRNYIRHNLVDKLSEEQKTKISSSLQNAKELNKKIDSLLNELSGQVFENDNIKRGQFQALPHDLSKELLAEWLRQNKINFDSKTLERLVVFCKTANQRSKTDITRNHGLQIQKDFISLIRAV